MHDLAGRLVFSSRDFTKGGNSTLDFHRQRLNHLRVACVVVENLTKCFKGPRKQSVGAVSNLNLTVADKELLVLVGPSGCGKTTTLRLIAGLEEITTGRILIDGQVVNDVAPRDRDVAMVFQHHALFPHMTARENMAFGLKLRKHSRDDIARRLDEAAEVLGLADCLDRRPEALSGGQRQRVALGRALVRKPKVFLFDEPLSNLDAQMRAQMRREIAKLHSRLAATMVYVTHDQVEALTLGDRVAVMRQGALQQVAAPMELYRNPANRFVAGFIGSPPMNFFHGILARAGTNLFFEEKLAPENHAAGIRVRVAEEMSARLSGRAGKEVVLGIRPEHITVQPGSAADLEGRLVEALAEVIEPMGPETFLYAAHGSRSFAARVPADFRVAVRETVSLVFDMQGAHYFDPATETVIAA
jgi:multiple sugar transport system ATP-binding protein